MYHSVQTHAREVVCFLAHLSALYSQILQYARITQSRITASFLVFSLVYCCAQIILQSLIFSFDSQYTNLLSGIIKAGNLPPENSALLQGNKGHMHLQICDDVPSVHAHPCTTIYDSTWNSILAQDLYAPQVLEGWEKGLNVTSIRSPLNTTQVINVRIETRDGSIVNLSEQCIEILLYPYQLYARIPIVIPIIHIYCHIRLRNFKDEDITCLCLQIWLLGISFIVVLQGSVPHT